MNRCLAYFYFSNSYVFQNSIYSFIHFHIKFQYFPEIFETPDPNISLNFINLLLHLSSRLLMKKTNNTDGISESFGVYFPGSI